MMGQQESIQGKLFYTAFSLEKRVRASHMLRKINEVIDFDFSYAAVKNSYGNNGNVSVPPPVILKLMLLLVFYNVRSERELLDTLPERLDWLWFLDFDLDSNIPNHSVLSKARKRWGSEVFESFFKRIVEQCVKAGLIDGSKIFMDASFIDANASINSVVDIQSPKAKTKKCYQELVKRLDDASEEGNRKVINKRFISATDPESAYVRQSGKKAKPCYLTHRAVEESNEIITAVKVTRGDANEAHHLMSLSVQHKENTKVTATTVVADTKYGTIDNYLKCNNGLIKAHIPDLKATHVSKATKIYPDWLFKYNKQTDSYICPAGKRLRKKSFHKSRLSTDYSAGKKNCGNCPRRPICTTNKSGRTIKRHLLQEELDAMRQKAISFEAKRDIKKRQHLMERSFARSVRYGFDKARWRGMNKVLIQEYLICAIQNMKTLVARGRKPLQPAKGASLWLHLPHFYSIWRYVVHEMSLYFAVHTKKPFVHI